MTATITGGYHLVGSQGIFIQGSGAANPERLYTSRLNNLGDTLWTKRKIIPGCYGFYPRKVIENGAGQVLVIGSSFAYSGTSQSDAFLALFSLQGDTLWTKRVASSFNDAYISAELLPGGDFLVAGQLGGLGTLQRFTPQGVMVWQQFPTYSATDLGGVVEMFPVAGVAGQYWATVGANSTTYPFPYKYVRFDANGVLGVEVPGLPGEIPRARTAAGTGYVVVGSDQISRLDANFVPVWTRTLTALGRSMSLNQVVPTADGNYLAGGETGSSGSGVTLNKVSPNGVLLKDTVFASRYGRVDLKGLAIDPLTGDYVFAGTINNGPIGGADIFWTQWRRSRITGSRQAQVAGAAWNAYPNPLADDHRLHLVAEQPLRGTLHLRDALGRHLGSWPAAGQRSQTLPLPALPAGLYLLTLESPTEPPRTLRLVQP